MVCPCAHAEIRTHACSVPRFAVVTRSESVGERAIPLVLFAVRCAERVMTVARAEAELMLDPDDGLRRVLRFG